MKPWFLLFLCTVIGSCANPGQDIPADSSAIANLLTLHNSERAQVSVGDLSWSAALADQAVAWGRNCRFEHSHGSTGENLYATSRLNISDSQAFSAAVSSWAAEKYDYFPNSNACASGAVCGHYTQMVWKTSRRVGCAVVKCSRGMASFQAGTLVVCEYDPPGNYVGQSPY
jgi:pathogenesis-related protein 1